MTPIVGYLRCSMDEELGATEQGAAEGAPRDGRLRSAPPLDASTTSSTSPASRPGACASSTSDYDFLDTVRRAIAWHADAFAERKLTLARGAPARARSRLRRQRPSRTRDDASCSTTPRSSRPRAASSASRSAPLETAYELCVADTGAGVAPDRSDRIFDPFYQVDGSATRELRRTRRRARRSRDASRAASAAT